MAYMQTISLFHLRGPDRKHHHMHVPKQISKHNWTTMDECGVICVWRSLLYTDHFNG